MPSAKEEVAAALARLQGLGFISGRADKAFLAGVKEASEALSRALAAWPAAGAAPAESLSLAPEPLALPGADVAPMSRLSAQQELIEQKTIYLVFGPPASGKTSWVEARRQPGDLVWDFDAIAATMAQAPSYPRPPHVSSALMTIRGALLDWLRTAQRRAFIITTEKDEAESMAQQFKPFGKLVGPDDRSGWLQPLTDDAMPRGFA